MTVHQPQSQTCLFLLIVLTVTAGMAAAQQQPANELHVTAGKSLVVSSAEPIERVAVGFGDVAEATAVGMREVLLQGKAPGSTSLIVWQQGGNKLFFDVTVHPNQTAADSRLEALRRQIQRELPKQNVDITVDNETIFLRGTVADLNQAQRAEAIASTLGKTVNLLYVDVPEAEAQILLKVRFASIDRTVSEELGMNLFSTGATNTIGAATTGQFQPPKIEHNDGKTTVTLSDALNVFLLRPDLNLGATIRALHQRALLEILAEPNVLAIDGKQASFLAGGEFPYPILQGGGLGLGAVTIQFREFGIRINFLPTITPRGTIRLGVAPEVSALDYANGLTFQGFTIPALTTRRVETEVELSSGQSFAIAGLLDRRLTENLSRIPLLGDVPLLGKLFRSKSLQRDNTELLVIVTPELVRPIPADVAVPQLSFPREVGESKEIRTPGISVTGTAAPQPAQPAMPVEELRKSIERTESISVRDQGGVVSLPYGGWQAQQPSLPMVPPAPAPAPQAKPLK